MDIQRNLSPNPLMGTVSHQASSEVTEQRSPDPMLTDQNGVDPEWDQTFSDPMSIDQTDYDPIVKLIADDKETTFRIPLSKLEMVQGLYGPLNHDENLKNRGIEVKYSREIVNLLLLFCFKYNNEDPTSLDDLEKLFIDGALSFKDLHAFYDMANAFAAPLMAEWIRKLMHSENFLKTIDQDVMKTLWGSVIQATGLEKELENEISDSYDQFILEFLLGQRLYTSEFEDVEQLLQLYLKNFSFELFHLFNQKNENGEFLFHLEVESLYPLIHYLMNPKEKGEEETSTRLEIAFSLLERFDHLLKELNLPAPQASPSPTIFRPLSYQEQAQLFHQHFQLISNHQARNQGQLLMGGPTLSELLTPGFQQNFLSPSPQVKWPSTLSHTSSYYLPFFCSIYTIVKNIEKKEDFKRLIDQLIARATLPDTKIPVIIDQKFIGFTNSASFAVHGLLSLAFDRFKNKEPIEMISLLEIGMDTLLKLEESNPKDALKGIFKSFNDIALNFLIKNSTVYFHLKVIEIFINFRQSLVEKGFKEYEIDASQNENFLDSLLLGFSALPISEISEKDIGIVHQMLLFYADKYPSDRIRFLRIVAHHYEKCVLHAKVNLIEEIEKIFFDLKKNFIFKKTLDRMRNGAKNKPHHEEVPDEMTIMKIKRIVELLEAGNRGKAKIKFDSVISHYMALESTVNAIIEHKNLGYQQALRFVKVLDDESKVKALRQIFAFLIEKGEFKKVIDFVAFLEKKQDKKLTPPFIDAVSNIAMQYLNKREISKALDIFEEYILKYLNDEESHKQIQLLLELLETKDESILKRISELAMPTKQYQKTNLYRNAFLPLICAAKMSLGIWPEFDLSEPIYLPAKTIYYMKMANLIIIPEILEKLKHQVLSHIERAESDFLTHEPGFDKRHILSTFYQEITEYCISIEDRDTLEEFGKIQRLHFLSYEIHNDIIILINKLSRQTNQGIDHDSIRNYFPNKFDEHFYDLGLKLGNVEDQDLLFAFLQHCPVVGYRYPIIAGYLEALSSKSSPAKLKVISQIPCEYQEGVLLSIEWEDREKKDRDLKCKRMIADEHFEIFDINREKLAKKDNQAKSQKERKKEKEKDPDKL